MPEVEEVHKESVENTVAWIQQQDPTGRKKDVGDHHRDDRYNLEDKFERQVGTRVYIGQKQGEQGRMQS